MTAPHLALSVLDWTALGFLASVLSLIVMGAYRLRQEIQDAARIEGEVSKEAAPGKVPDRR
jgi:hypothetical protein